MGARGKLFLLSVLLVVVNIEVISGQGTQCPENNEGLAVHLPHEANCSLFYQCDWGVAILKECPAGLHFNPVLQVCDWPDNAGCQSGGDGDGNGVDNGGNGDGDNGDNSDGNGEGDNGGSSDGDNNGSEGNGDSDGNGGSSGGNECPVDNEGDAVHLPHDSDCGLFYQCDWGVAILKECPAGLHFNPVLQVCDWPANAGCQSEGDVDGNGGDDIGNGDGDNGDNSDGNGEGDNGGSSDGDNNGSEGNGDSDGNGGSSGGNECPVDNEGDAVHLPHDSDCGLFYQCDWGVAILKECPAGLHFNPVLQVCDWPANAGCQSEGDVDGNGGDDIGNGDGDNGDNSDGNGEGDNGGSGDGDNDSSEDDGDSDVNGGSSGGNECPADNESDTVHLPHDSDCGLFYQCDWGVPILKECPAGLHFNPVLQVCDWPANAGCQSEGDVDGNGGDDIGNGDGDNGDNSDGNGEGDNGGSGDGDNDSSEDDSDSDVNGGSSEGNECPADNEGDAIHLPHDSDCGLFYQCDWGVAVLKECPAGLHFNPVLQVCDWPDNAGCQSGGDDDGNGVDNGGNGVGDNGDNSDGNGEGDNDGSSDGDSDGSEGDGGSVGNGGNSGENECPADNEGDAVHLPHESDCSLFYQCDWGVAVLKECPAGLHFNPVLQVCDWPNSPGCQSGGGDDGSVGDGDNDDNGDGVNDSDGDDDDNGNSSSEEPSTGGGSGFCNSIRCPEENEEYVTFIPNAEDCTRFCKCNWGLAYEFVCPAGLFFNPALNVCDYPERAGCNSS